MEFKQREEYTSETGGRFYQISHNEFVHGFNASIAGPIYWMKGNNRIYGKFATGTPLGVVGNSFFFEEDNIIKKVEPKNEDIVVTQFLTIEKGIKVLFKRNSLHYFIKRYNSPYSSFAIPIIEDYRSNYGIKFNVLIDELEEYDQIHVQDNVLLGITDHRNSFSIRRFQSNSEYYLERKGLPFINKPDILCPERTVIFNDWIFYISEGNLISVNINDLSFEHMKTNLQECSHIVGIDDNGFVNVQKAWNYPPVHLYTAQLPEKYIKQANMRKLVEMKEKRIEELERKVETGQKEKEELFNAKNVLEVILAIQEKSRNDLEKRLKDKNRKEAELVRRLEDQKKKEELLVRNKEELEKGIEKMEEEMKDLKLKHSKLLFKVSTWDSDHAEKK